MSSIFFIFDWAATYVSSGLEPNGGSYRVLSSVPAPIRNEYAVVDKKWSGVRVDTRDGEHRVSGGANGRAYKLRGPSAQVPKSSQS